MPNPSLESRPEISRLAEYELTKAQRTQCGDLISQAFDDLDFQGRCFYKQKPHFRFLAMNGLDLVGHLAVDYRAIRADSATLSIFGILDVVVAPHRQRQGIGSALLGEAEKLARKSDVDFLVLLTDQHGFYERHGFERVTTAPARWLGIHQMESHAIMTRDVGERLMCKPVNAEVWPEGKIDFAGYLF